MLQDISERLTRVIFARSSEHDRVYLTNIALSVQMDRGSRRISDAILPLPFSTVISIINCQASFGLSRVSQAFGFLGPNGLA